MWCRAGDTRTPSPIKYATIRYTEYTEYTEYTVLRTNTKPGCELIKAIIKEARFKAIILAGCPNFADSITC